MTADPILSVEDVVLGYGSLEVVSGVSLAVGRAELVGLVGGNGSGKSTILRAVSGMIAPWRGRIVFDDSIAGLAASSVSRITVQFERPPADAALAVLPGVRQVAGEGASRTLLTDATFSHRALLEAALAGDWGLTALVPERRSLEDLFVQLTCGEAA